MIYEWSKGARQKLDAQVVGERLDLLRERNGGELTPDLVVEDASTPESVLHEAFEWDDAEAAVEWRRQQARLLINHITVRFEERPEQEPVRAFVIIRQDNEQAYQSTIVALSDPSMRQQILARAWRELESWRRRYHELEEFAAIFAAMETEVA